MKARSIYLIAALSLAVGAVRLPLVNSSADAANSPTSSSVIWTDHFSSTTLDSRWSWINEAADHWSLTAYPGFMRITTQDYISDFHNLLVQNVPAGGYEIQTRVVFTPTQNYQVAGIIIYQDGHNALKFGRAFCDHPMPECVGNGIYYDRIEGDSFLGSNYPTTTTAQGDIHLSLIRQGAVYTGYMSNDGVNWTLVGAHTVTITPTKIGLLASNQTQGDAEIPADFDFFTLIDYSKRLFAPIVVR